MVQVIRTVDIGDWNDPHPWKAVMFETEFKDEAIVWINEQPSWLKRELSIEEKEDK